MFQKKSSRSESFSRTSKSSFLVLSVVCLLSCSPVLEGSFDVKSGFIGRHLAVEVADVLPFSMLCNCCPLFRGLSC
jgi:hypothetical protein